MNKAEELCHSSGPWKKHKYFEKKAKNDELEHSSGPWKKHKYISKVGEGANAVYKYAKNKVTGEGYKERAASWEASAKDEDERAKYIKKEIYDPAHEEGDEEWKRLSKNVMKGARENALEYRKTAAGYREDYRTKSLKGIAETTIKRGQKKIDEILHPKTKITITSNLMPAGTKKTYYKK